MKKFATVKCQKINVSADNVRNGQITLDVFCFRKLAWCYGKLCRHFEFIVQ